MLQLCVVPDTSAKLVAPAVEVVVYASPVEMRITGSTGLRPYVPSGPRFCVAPLSVGCLHNQTHLFFDMFGSPDLEGDLGVDDLAPVEHRLGSDPSFSIVFRALSWTSCWTIFP